MIKDKFVLFQNGNTIICPFCKCGLPIDKYSYWNDCLTKDCQFGVSVIGSNISAYYFYSIINNREYRIKQYLNDKYISFMITNLDNQTEVIEFKEIIELDLDNPNKLKEQLETLLLFS